MLSKNRQWICKFIVLFVLISGVCFEHIKADTFFEYAFWNSPGTYLQTGEETIGDAMACTVETLGVRTAILHQTVGRLTNARRELKPSVAFLCVVAGWQLLSYFFTTEQFEQLPLFFSASVVVDYIHSTDGKKRI